MPVRGKEKGAGKQVIDEKNTNKYFAKTDTHFQEACILAEVKPTKRQASKFRNSKGIAYKTVTPGTGK
jgi:hypothetical protein